MNDRIIVNVLLLVVLAAVVCVLATAVYFAQLLVRSIASPAYKPNRRTAVLLPVLCAVLLGLVSACLPPVGDNMLNGVVLDEAAQEAVTLASKQFHRTLAVTDLHADPLMWTYRNLRTKNAVGHVDLPRLLEGNVAVQVFSIVTQAPVGLNFHSNSNATDTIGLVAAVQRWPVAAWTSKLQRALHSAANLHKLAAADSRLRVVQTAADLDEAVAAWRADTAAKVAAAAEGAGGADGVAPQPSFVAGIIGVEGMQCAEGLYENFDRLYDAGVRVMGLTHFVDNELGGSATGTEKGGLTDLGRKMVARMEAKGVVIDLAHVSEAVIDDVLGMTSKPLIVSHTGIRGACELPRNVPDRQALEIAKKGGVIGISFFKEVVCGTEVSDIVRSIRYAAKLLGVPHVAIGSDFDGTVKTPFDSAHMSTLTHALLADGFTPEEVEAMMSGNSLRVLRASLEPLA